MPLLIFSGTGLIDEVLSRNRSGRTDPTGKLPDRNRQNECQ